MLPMKQAILFDNDGTLSDSVPICQEATNQVLTARGFLPVSLAQISAGMRLETPLRMMEHAGIDDIALGRIMSDEYYIQAQPLAEKTKIFPGIAEMLEQLIDAGFKLGIVSNNSTTFIQRVLERNKISRFFSVLIGDDNADEIKPLPGGLLQACRILGVKPEDAVYVGDGPSDVKAAASASIRSIGACWDSFAREKIRQMGFDRLVETPADVFSSVSTLSS